jgi:excisionase family DNA binding protein
MSVERLAYTSAEAAAALGVSTDHVRRMIRSGEIRAVRLGAALLVPVIELERLLGIDRPTVQVTPEQILDAVTQLVGRPPSTPGPAPPPPPPPPSSKPITDRPDPGRPPRPCRDRSTTTETEPPLRLFT